MQQTTFPDKKKLKCNYYDFQISFKTLNAMQNMQNDEIFLLFPLSSQMK